MSIPEYKNELPRYVYLDIEEHFEDVRKYWIAPEKEEDREKFQNVVELCVKGEEVYKAIKRGIETDGRHSTLLLPKERDDYRLAIGAFDGKDLDVRIELVSAAKRAFEVLAGTKTRDEVENGDIEAGKQLAGHLIRTYRMHSHDQS